MARKRALGGFSIPWWAWVGLAAVTPVVLINTAIAWLGDTHVSPLSLSFLEMKVNALRTYVAHRPSCVLDGHEPLEPLIARAERRHGLPAGLLQALVLVESEGRVHRISPAGAMGPGQLMPTTAVMLGVEDPFDPAPALDGSARYLAEQLRRFRDVRLAVAAYNAGPGAVDGRVPRNGETEYYVPKVLTAWVRTRPPEPPPRPVPVVAARARPVVAVVAKPVAPVRPAVAPVSKKAGPKVAAKPVAPVRPKVVAKVSAAPARSAVVAKPVAPKAKPKSAAGPAKAPTRATQAKPAVTVNTRPG
ncbi:transglycosylase SLT domain-containing protein [Myxococcus sp. CA056]|uniref:lytic transglycosylase domain-containing protein n=1 Tax=Myxococcus sp. CA056 TaxID=2741740 RepID=UPI00157B4B4E|nr:transglycosylase SLT domain-containing protein [Myxococcus sp. CA056]